MAWIRTGVFVSLTLVATTLPVIARPAPTVETPAQAALAASQLPADVTAPADNHEEQSPAPRDSREPSDDGGLLLQAAWQMDVWKSGPARAMGNSGPQLTAAIASCTTAVPRPSPGRGQDLQSHASRVHEHAREWLACRYPNAPPSAA